MDLRVYFQKMRQTETSIMTPEVVVVSLETPDGGKPGVRTEVERGQAARLIVENRARLATVEEADAFRSEVAEQKKLIDQQAMAAKVQLAVISDGELRSLKSAKSNKG